MTPEELPGNAHLINLWNCSEPMTEEQVKRMEELDEKAKAGR